MNWAKLRLLAAPIATVVAAGIGITVWAPFSGTTLADLADAGIGSCPTRLVSCDFHINEDGVNILADAGITTSRSYITLGVRTAACLDLDGGRAIVLPPFPMPMRHGLRALDAPDLASCTVDADPGGALWRVVPSFCLRQQPDAGPDCTLLDGGNPGAWNAYPRAQMTGADCVSCACVRFAGVDDGEED